MAPEKALKYHSALVRRPSPGYLFDRFYGAWLEAATTAELETFLQGRVAKKKAGAAAAASGISDEVTVARLLLAFFYSKRGDDARSMAELQSVVAADDSNPTAWYELARARARLLDFAGAVAALEKAAEAHPEDALALEVEKLRGRLLVRAGDSAAALKAWRELLLANPDDDELAEELIEAQLDEGLLEEAILSSEALVERTRDAYLKVQRRLRTGDLYGRAENREKALAAYGEALVQTGANTWIERQALAQIERLFRRQDDLEGLKRFYAEAGQDLRRRLQVQLGEAELLANLGEIDVSLTAWREILRQTPGDRSLRERFVQALTAAEQFDEALAQVTALTEMHPADGELLALRAEVEFSAGRKKQAVASLRRYLEMSGEQGSEGLWVRVAKRLEAAEMLDEAETLLKQAIGRWPKGATVREEYAALLHRTDKRELAVAEWRAMAAESVVGAGDEQASPDEEAAVRLRVARALMTRSEGEVALEILLAPLAKDGDSGSVRQAKFFEHAGYLPALADAAERCGDYEQAARWAKEHLLRVTRPDELPTAVERVARMMRKAGSLQGEIDRLEKEAKSPVQHCLLAELLEVSGAAVEADEVLTEYETTIAEGDALAADLIAAQRVRLLRLRRDWVTAAEVTESMLGDGREGLRSSRLRTMVELLARAGDFEAVMKWLPEWKKASPGSTAPWMEESRILQQAGRMDDAIQVLRQAVQRFDDDEPLRVRLAEMYASNGDRADAERLYWQLYEAAEKTDAKISWAGRLAELAGDGGSVPQLVEKFEERRRANRQSPIPLLALAAVYRMTDEYEKRREVLLDATRLRPDDVGLLRVIAGIEREEGEVERARLTLQSAVELDGSNESLRHLARFELEYGEADEGFRILEEMHREAGALSTGDAVDVARSMAKGDHWQRIVDFLDPILETNVESVELAWLRATALEELRRYDEAIDGFYQALEAVNSKSWSSTAGSLTATSFHWAGQEFRRRRKAVLPPTGQLILFDSELSEKAYDYRSFAGGPLPSVRDEVVSMMLTHLALCDREPTILKIEDRAARAEAVGVDSAMQRLMAIWELQASLARTYKRNRCVPYVSGPPESVFELFPDDVGVQSIRISGHFGVARSQLVELQELERIFTLLDNDFPDVAFATAISGLNGIFRRSDDQKDAAKKCRPLLQRAIDSGMARQSASYPGLVNLGSQLGAWSSNSWSLPEDYRRELSEVLIRWHELAQHESWAAITTSRYSGFAVVAAVMLRGSEKTRAIDLLEKKLASERAAGNASASTDAWSKMASGSGFSQVDRPLSPMPYPPPELPGFPAEVAGMLVVPERRASHDFENGIPGLPRERVAAVEDPLLRALLAWHGKFPKLEEAAVEELRAKANPTVADLLMSAGKAALVGDLLTSARALSAVRSMPLSPSQRTVVDGALAVSVVELSGKEREAAGEDYPGLQAAGKAAAMRFRQWATDREQRLTLLGLLEDYGLDEEAERIQRQLDLGRQRLARAKARSDMGSLIESGQRDEALRQAVRKVRVEAARHSRSWRIDIDYQRREFFDSLWVHGLRDDVIEAIDPGDSMSARRWFDFSFVCFALEDHRRMIEALRRVLEIRPDHDFAVHRWVQMLTAHANWRFDAEEFVAVLRNTVNAEQFAGALSVASTHFQQSENEGPVHFRDLVPAVVAVLKDPVGGAAEKGARWSGALDLLEGCQEYWSESVYGLPALVYIPGEGQFQDERSLARTAASGGVPPWRGQLWKYDSGETEAEDLVEDVAVMKAAMAERRKIFDELAAVLAERDEAAESCFLLQLQVAEAQGDELSDLEPLAWRIVAMNEEERQYTRRMGRPIASEQIAKQPPLQRMMYFENLTRGYRDDGRARERRPEEFLIHRAAEAGGEELAKVRSKLLMTMEKAGASVPDIDATKAYATLLAAADGEAFSNAALSVLKTLPEPPRRPGERAEVANEAAAKKPRRATAEGVMAGVFDVWRDRELTVDLGPVVSAYFQHKRQGGSSSTWITDQMAEWMSTMRERDSDWLTAFAEAVAEDFFGPEDGREQRLKDERIIYQANELKRQQNIDLPGTDLQRFFGIFAQMDEQPDVAFAFAEEIEKRCPGIGPAELLMHFYQNRSRQEWSELFQKAGFSCAAEAFRCYLEKPDSKDSTETVLGRILDTLREASRAGFEYRGGTEWLDVDTFGDTFGGGLILSALQPMRQGFHEPKMPLACYYAGHLDEIRAAPQRTQRELAALAVAELRQYYAIADLERLDEVFDWARQFYRLPDSSDLDAVLKLDSWDELKPLRNRNGFNESALDFVRLRLPQLADSDPEKAWAVLEKIERLGPVKGADGASINVMGLHGYPLISLLRKVRSTKALSLVVRGIMTWDEVDREVDAEFRNALQAQLVAAMAGSDVAKRQQNMSQWCDEMFAALEFAQQHGSGSLGDETVAGANGDVNRLWVVFDLAIAQFLDSDLLAGAVADDPYATSYDQMPREYRLLHPEGKNSRPEKGAMELLSERLCQWSSGVVNEGTPAAGFARRVLAVKKLYESRKLAIAEGDPDLFVKAADEWIRPIVTLLDEEEAPIGNSLRIWLTDDLRISDDIADINAPASRASAVAMADMWRLPWVGDEEIEYEFNTDNLLAFVRLDAFRSGDPEWEESVAELLDGWNNWMRSRSNPPSYDAIIAMTDIGLRRAKQGDDAGRLAAVRTLRRYREFVAEAPDMITLLVSHGEANRAARFVAESWEKMSAGYQIARFSASTAEHLPTYLQNFSGDAGLRYYAELQVSLAPDLSSIDGGSVEGFPSHRERVADLARRFSTIEFNDPDLRRMSLKLLLNQEGSQKALQSVVEQEWNKIHWSGLGHATNNEAHWVASLIAHRLTDLSEQSDTGVAIYHEIFTGLEQAKPRLINPDFQLEKWVLPMVQARVMAQLEQMSPERVMKFLPALNFWMAEALTWRGMEQESAVGMQVLISWWAGEAGTRQLAEWRAGLDEEVSKAWLAAYHDNDELFQAVHYAINPLQGHFVLYAASDPDIRGMRERLLRCQRMIEGMLTDPWIAESFREENDWMGIYPLFEENDLASSSDLLLHADALAAASSRGEYRAWIDLSRIASPRGELELLDRAIGAALNDEDRLRGKLEKVEVLINLNQQTAAKVLFEAIRDPLTKLAEEGQDLELSEVLEVLSELVDE